MARSFFCSCCPYCQTQSQVAVRLIGREIHCPQCSRAFSAHDRENASAALLDPIQYWIKYTEHNWNDDREPTSDGQKTPRSPR